MRKIGIGILHSNWIFAPCKLGSLWINKNTLSLLQACFLPGTLALAHHHGLSLTATLPPKDANQHSQPSNNVLMEVRKLLTCDPSKRILQEAPKSVGTLCFHHQNLLHRKKCPLEFSPKIYTKIHQSRKILVDKKCPREFVKNVHENSSSGNVH